MGFLKLAEYWVKRFMLFLISDNRTRVILLQVFESSQQHVFRVSNPKDIVLIIYAVLESNDPIAKSMTMRLLGSLAEISQFSLELQHQLFDSLKNPDITNYELASAIFTSSRIASFNEQFAFKLFSLVYELEIEETVKKTSSNRLEGLYTDFEFLYRPLENAEKV